MLDFDVSKSIGCWIGLAHHEFQRAMNHELTPEGITYRQCQVLAWLVLEDNLSQVDLAERMNIEPSTLVRVLDRMERDGLLVREPCPGDRRRRIIKATRKAEPIWKRIVACGERIDARAGRGLSAKQLQTLRELLEAARANLVKPAPVEKKSRTSGRAKRRTTKRSGA